jgi:hypothetical protein
MKRYVSIAVKILAGIAIPASLAITSSDNSWLVDVPSAILVFIPAIVAAICLRLGTGQHWARTFLVLGVPLGLVSTSIGLVQIVYYTGSGDVTNVTFVGPAMAVCLLTLLYGGLVSAIGFAALEKDDLSPRHTGSVLWWALPMALTFALLVWGVYAGGRLQPFLRTDVLLVTLASIVTFMSFRRSTPPITRWAEATLFSSIICVGVGVLDWFANSDYAAGNIDVDAIIFASVGVLYGCALYIGAYFYSFRNGQSKFNDGPRMNWHFLEVNAFLYFITIAPTSLPESLNKIETSKQLATQQKELSERITALEAEVKRLSRE